MSASRQSNCALPSPSKTDLNLLSDQRSLDVLEENDYEQIYKLITDENCAVRHEVANFVQQTLFQETAKPKGVSLEAAQLRDLVEFISKTDIPTLPNYVIDALWGKLNVLTVSIHLFNH